MKLHRIKLAGLTLILLIAGCIEQEKDDLTIPVSVQFRINVKHDFDRHAWFNNGYIGLQGIQFEGIREAGGNVYFETNPEEFLQPKELYNLPATITIFDIPQGIYNYMRWDITLKRIVNPSDFDEDTDSLSVGLVLYGTYELWDDPWFIPIIFAIDDTEEFIGRFSGRIALSANKDYIATLILDGNVARMTTLEAAEITGDGQFQRIVITSTINKDLYEKILYQLEWSARVTIEEIGPATL